MKRDQHFNWGASQFTQTTKDTVIRKSTVGKYPLERNLRLWLDSLLLKKLDI